MSYPINFVSIMALCGKPEGTKVSKRIISRNVASVYGKLKTGIKKIFSILYL